MPYSPGFVSKVEYVINKWKSVSYIYSQLSISVGSESSNLTSMDSTNHESKILGKKQLKIQITNTV